MDGFKIIYHSKCLKFIKGDKKVAESQQNNGEKYRIGGTEVTTLKEVTLTLEEWMGF